MASVHRGLGKSFDKIFGNDTTKTEEKVTNETNQNVAVNSENEIKKETDNNENVQVVEKIVEVPVEKIVEKVVEVPVEKVVEKIVEVPAKGDGTEKNDGAPLLVNINFVQANPNQPRKTFDEEALKDLAESIENYGIIEPIIVHKTSPIHYEVIAGERRLRAAHIAGLTEVPVIVKEYDERQRKEIALIENVQREDLNAVEKALGYKALIDEYNMTQEELAVKIGKSRSAITNALRILSLDEKIINLIKSGELTEGHARSLLSIEDEDIRQKLVEKVINEKMSVRKLEDLIRCEKLAKNRKERDEAIETEEFRKVKIQIKDIERQMRDKLGSTLKIIPKDENAGTIEIKYTSGEELDRIYLLINSIEK